MNQNTKIFLVIIILFFSIYSFTSDGHRTTSDEDYAQQQALRIVLQEPDPEFVPGESGKALSLEELARDRFVIGTPEDCIEACQAHRDELGCSHLIVRMNFPGMPQRNVINAIELFGREVLPHLS